MSDNTWVKVYRKITEWGWYKHLPTCHLFRHLCIRAKYKDGPYRGKDLKRGQLLTGRKQLAFETGLSEQQVKTALKNLQKTGEITIEATKAFSVITVCNYSMYQDSENTPSTNDNANNQPTTTPTINQQSTNNQPTINHIQEIKNASIKEIKNQNLLFPDAAGASPEPSPQPEQPDIETTDDSVGLQPPVNIEQVNVEIEIEQPKQKPKKVKEEKPEPIGRATRLAYMEAYERRYGAEPLIGVMENSIIANIVKRVGQEEAPGIVAHYLKSHNSFYIAKGHDLPTLSSNLPKLRTEWLTGRQGTQTQARQQDNTYTRVSNIVEAAMKVEHEKRIGSGSDNNGGTLQLAAFSASVESGD